MQARLEQALSQGERLRLVPVERLHEVRDDLRTLEARVALNGFQRWIVHELYALELPPLAFAARSIVLVAIPHPPYALVDLAWEGRTHRCMSLVRSDFEGTGRALAAGAAAEGVRLAPAPDVPMKRLAVRSGLAVYGRNNVGYVEGLGSHFSLAAWYSDAPGQEEACLSYLNESPAPFPAWLPAGIHHTVYDCLRCQLRCPMNKGRGAPPIGPIAFSEEETGHLLAGTPFERLPAALAAKARPLGFQDWGAGIARNLRALFAQQAPA